MTTRLIIQTYTCPGYEEMRLMCLQLMVQLLETSWLNPFSPDQDEFVSLSTSTVATPNVANDLLEAHKICQFMHIRPCAAYFKTTLCGIS